MDEGVFRKPRDPDLKDQAEVRYLDGSMKKGPEIQDPSSWLGLFRVGALMAPVIPKDLQSRGIWNPPLG